MTHSFLDLTKGLAGCFLMSSPFTTSPAFAQTVVFICAYSPKEGTMGIVINRHIAKPTPKELLNQLGIKTMPTSNNFSITAGGPIENAHGLVLHTNDWKGKESVYVTKQIKLSTSLDILRDLSEGHGPSKALLALGHANWSPGQLEEELNNNLWYVAPCQESILYNKNFKNKWSDCYKSILTNPRKLSLYSGEA